MSIFSKAKTNLFSFNNQDLTRWSIFILIMLDIFLLSTIVNGVSSERKMAPTIDQRYPYSCTKNYFSEDKRKIPSEFSYDFFDTYNYDYYVPATLTTSASCKSLRSVTDVFTESNEFENNKKLLKALAETKRLNLLEIEKIESRYNTKLFERITDSGTDFRSAKNKYYTLLQKEKDLLVQINSVKKVTQLKGFTEYLTYVKDTYDSFKKEYDSYSVWRPFLAYAYLLKFAFPLFLISFLLYRFARKREESITGKILKIISSHLILLSSIPMFIGTLVLIFDIIPHKLLKKVIAFLYEFGLMFLGYYGLIAISIVFFGAIIFFIQRNKAKSNAKNKYFIAFNQSKCPTCNIRVSSDQVHCHNCSEQLKVSCPKCNSLKINHFKYCDHCGSQD